MITVIIPTKNRPGDLAEAVASILAQTTLPEELIIVDQSPGQESRRRIEALCMGRQHPRLRYLHDTAISGLVEAKQVGVAMAEAEIICFLEDDIVLEKAYLEQIEKGFDSMPEMLGCCGVVTNPPRMPVGYSLIFKLFHRGIFKDPRVDVFGSFSGKGHSLIESDVLSGGLSAWRRHVFSMVPFDVANGFFMLEDMEFSTRVARRFGHLLYINPNARLAHNFSPANREVLGTRQCRKLTEYITYYKKRRTWPGAHLAFLWLLLGLCAEAVFQSFTARSFSPIGGYFRGIRRGVAKRLVERLTSTAGPD